MLQAAETYLTVREMSVEIAEQERVLRTELRGRFELLSDFGVIIKLKCGCGHEFYTHPSMPCSWDLDAQSAMKSCPGRTCQPDAFQAGRRKIPYGLRPRKDQGMQGYP